jgi:cysteine desulfuration protein SufE
VVHFAAEREGDEIRFHAGSDAAIVQGLIALLIRVYSQRTPDEILSTDAQFLAEIGLDSHLSATRKTGLASMMSAIKASAG